MSRRHARAVRILVVEDDRDLGPHLVQALAAESLVADLVRTGWEATSRAASIDYAVIVLDQMLPDSDGLDVCRRLRGASNDTPVLMLSSHDAVEDRIAGLDAGADDYLTKPFSIRELTARIRALSRRSRRTKT